MIIQSVNINSTVKISHGDLNLDILFLSTPKNFIISKNKDTTFVAVCGFSAGGTKTWSQVNNTIINFVGLIDPTTSNPYLKYAESDWVPNTKLMCNPSNWGGYKEIRNNLNNIVTSGKTVTTSPFYKHRNDVEYVTLKHADIPKSFFKKYGAELDGRND